MVDGTLFASEDNTAAEGDTGEELEACSKEKLDSSRCTALLGLELTKELLEVNVELLEVANELE